MARGPTHAGDRIALGAFSVESLIGRGAMAEVWRATHVPTGRPVAVKVVTAAGARADAFVAAMAAEVRAVAALAHPSVVTVHDYGVAEAHGWPAAGSPYLAMELAHGTLADEPPEAWPALRAALLTVLDALAHAHARGVVHRDIKPRNVLVGCAVEVPPAPGRVPGVKLTDFGLAILPDAAVPERHAAAGTPLAMAPEQFVGAWRDFGPWTDLYGVGCLAYRLASGRPPFVGTPTELARLHLNVPVPPLRARFAVPEGFEGWVARLLQKRPRARFRWASDAAAALESLADPTTDPTAPIEPPGADDLPTLPDTTAVDPGGGSDPDGVGFDGPAGLAQVVARPMLPADPPGDAHAERLAGAGLGLYGLRPVPLIGRRGARDALWDALGEITRTGSPVAVGLLGPAGSGKSRLARWIGEAAHEVGAALSLRAHHDPSGGPATGLGPMLERQLGTGGLAVEAIFERISARLRAQGERDPLEARALTQLLRPGAPATSTTQMPALRLGSPLERELLFERALTREAEGRPIVLWLDDVQWGLGALQLAEHLLQRASAAPLPVLVVLTARDDLLAGRPLEAARLELLRRQPAWREIEVGPLPVGERRALVHALLGLTGEVAARVDERTAGNPLFAVQLVGDWVARGLLVPAERGFQLREGAITELPDDLFALWAGRLDEVLSRRAVAERHAIELAAVLGQIVDAAEWRAAAGLAGLDVPWTLVEDLLAMRLAVREPGAAVEGWTFVHGMLREALLRGAAEAGRLSRWHGVCARMLAEARPVGYEARLGHHLIGAGDVEAALGPLLSGALFWEDRSDFARVEQLLEDRERAMEALALPEEDERRAPGWLASARLSTAQGRYDDAERCLDRLDAVGERAPPVDAAVMRGRLHFLRGRMEAARACLEPAAARLAGDARPAELARCLRALSALRLRAGDLAGSARDAGQAADTSARAGEGVGEGEACNLLSAACRIGGDFDAALAWAERARAAFADAGSRAGLAAAANGLGEIHRLRGDWPRAEAAYRDALVHYSAVSLVDVVYPEVNLGLVLVEQGLCDEADAILRRARETFKRLDMPTTVATVEVCRLPCVAARADWADWDRALREGGDVLRAAGYFEEDAAHMAFRGGRIAAELGETSRGLAALSLAAHQFEGLGRPDQVALVEAVVASLTTP